MALRAPPQADHGTAMYTLQDFREHALRNCRVQYEWVTEDFDYTFVTCNNLGKAFRLLHFANKPGSDTEHAWVTPEGQCYFGTIGRLKKTDDVLCPGKGYTDIVAPFCYIYFVSSEWLASERYLMRKDILLLVSFVNLFHNEIQGIDKVDGRNLLVEFEKLLNLMWMNSEYARRKNIESFGKRKRPTGDIDVDSPQGDLENREIDELESEQPLPTPRQEVVRSNNTTVDITDPFPAMQAVLERTTQCITAKNKAQWLEVQIELEKDLKSLEAVRDTSDGDTSKAVEGVIEAANLVQIATSRSVFK